MFRHDPVRIPDPSRCCAKLLLAAACHAREDLAVIEIADQRCPRDDYVVLAEGRRRDAYDAKILMTANDVLKIAGRFPDSY